MGVPAILGPGQGSPWASGTGGLAVGSPLWTPSGHTPLPLTGRWAGSAPGELWPAAAPTVLGEEAGEAPSLLQPLSRPLAGWSWGQERGRRAQVTGCSQVGTARSDHGGPQTDRVQGPRAREGPRLGMEGTRGSPGA